MNRIFDFPRRLLLPSLLAVLVACGGEADSEAATAEAEMATETDAAAEMETAPDVMKWGDGLLNPNIAGEAEIEGVASITPEAAATILEGRPFADMVALDAAIAAHMDEGAREALYGEMWIPLNLNTASEEEMLLIPGVGDRMAHEFDEYRPYDGMPRFEREIGKYVDEETVATYARYVFIPIDLNTATDEEILRIPGVGDRLLHEFKEYRPYESMAQFRREIGKYVDDAELERLARYVTLAGN